MASLRDLQLGFGSALRGGSAAAIAAHVRPNGLAPARRIAIYANNVRESFLGTLEATYPVLLRLAGRDWLRQCGRRYRREHPSRCGNLHHVGEHFSTWLATEVADGPYAYFVDAARLEWAYQEVLVAAEPGVLDTAALAAVAPDRHAEIVFRLSPAARLVESVFPVFAIWQAHRGDGEPPAIALDGGPSRVLVIRRPDHVELRELPPSDFALLGAVARHRPLAAALDAALEADSDVDAAACLGRCLGLGAFSGFRLPNPSPLLRSHP